MEYKKPNCINVIVLICFVSFCILIYGYNVDYYEHCKTGPAEITYSFDHTKPIGRIDGSFSPIHPFYIFKGQVNYSINDIVYNFTTDIIYTDFGYPITQSKKENIFINNVPYNTDVYNKMNIKCPDSKLRIYSQSVLESYKYRRSHFINEYKTEPESEYDLGKVILTYIFFLNVLPILICVYEYMF